MDCNIAEASLVDCSLNETILNDIIDDIRSSLPDDLVLSQVPTINEHTPSAVPVIHVDSFLYDDDAIDHILIPQGKIASHYTRDYGLHNESPAVISHSLSVKQLRYIFQYMLPCLSHKTLVDVGSRLGAVLYGAYLLSDATTILGVEIDPLFCDLQSRVISKYNFSHRIQVVCDDICNELSLLKTADVVILNNVFEFFCSKETQTKIWLCLRGSLIKSGSLLVTSPSLHSSLEHLETGIVIEEWVVQLDLSNQLCAASHDLFDATDPKDTELANLFCYRVL